MILVIDTYNVLHVVGILPPEMAGIDVNGLMQLLSASRYASNRIELVCDGTPTAEIIDTRGTTFRVRYAGPTHQADDLIAALIAESSAPKGLLVVSSDQWIVRQARRRRCRTMSSENFLRKLAKDAASSRGLVLPTRSHEKLPDSEVARWMDIFRISPHDLPRQPLKAQPPAMSPPAQEPTSPQPPSRPARSHEPLPMDIIAQAERIWAEQDQS